MKNEFQGFLKDELSVISYMAVVVSIIKPDVDLHLAPRTLIGLRSLPLESIILDIFLGLK